MAAVAIFVLALIGSVAIYAGVGNRGLLGSGGAQEFTVSTTPEMAGHLEVLVKKFNEKYKGQYTAKYQEAPALREEYHDKLLDELPAGDIDLIAGDVIWSAQFAANGWIADLSDRFPESERQKFLPGPIQSNVWEDKIYGVPWHTDTGVLYYRKDLLKQAGFSEPPKTWPELKEMAQATTERTGTPNGFVFQGSTYEGGVVNGLEYIYSHGGQVFDPDDPAQVVIDNPRTVAGLQTERSMVTDEVAPGNVVTDMEEGESQATFLNGNAVFCRNWLSMNALTAQGPGAVKQYQMGVAPLPAGEGGKSVSFLGGSNFHINARSDAQDAAWEFIKFATAPRQQKLQAEERIYLPTLTELYNDQTVAKEYLPSAQPRPVSPYYAEMSIVMAEHFNRSLKGDISPEQATRMLQEELQSILEERQGG